MLQILYIYLKSWHIAYCEGGVQLFDQLVFISCLYDYLKISDMKLEIIQLTLIYTLSCHVILIPYQKHKQKETYHLKLNHSCPESSDVSD